MTFEAGKSGNPRGRPQSKKAFSDALNRAIKRAKTEGGPCALELIADRLVNEALKSEAPLPAIREIADRLDGKPAQAIIGDKDQDGIQHDVRVTVVDNGH